MNALKHLLSSEKLYARTAHEKPCGILHCQAQHEQPGLIERYKTGEGNYVKLCSEKDFAYSVTLKDTASAQCSRVLQK